MFKPFEGLQRLLKSDEGASLVEYSLALLLIAIVTMTMVALLGDTLSTFFTNAASSI